MIADDPRIKRIFITGAPGSQWATIDRIIRNSLVGIDNTDVTPERTGVLHGNRPNEAVHFGAYLNWGGETGDWILDFGKYSRQEIIEKIDGLYNPPIPDEGKSEVIRIYKSHHFALHLPRIKELFPDAAILTVWQEAHKSYVWWEHCGGHDTLIGGYEAYGRDYEFIWNKINLIKFLIEDWVRNEGLEYEVCNRAWFQKHFGRLKHSAPKDEWWDNQWTLVVPADRGLNLSNTQRVSILNPWNPNK